MRFSLLIILIIFLNFSKNSQIQHLKNKIRAKLTNRNQKISLIPFDCKYNLDCLNKLDDIKSRNLKKSTIKKLNALKVSNDKNKEAFTLYLKKYQSTLEYFQKNNFYKESMIHKQSKIEFFELIIATISEYLKDKFLQTQAYSIYLNNLTLKKGDKIKNVSFIRASKNYDFVNELFNPKEKFKTFLTFQYSENFKIKGVNLETTLGFSEKDYHIVIDRDQYWEVIRFDKNDIILKPINESDLKVEEEVIEI